MLIDSSFLSIKHIVLGSSINPFVHPIRDELVGTLVYPIPVLGRRFRALAVEIRSKKKVLIFIGVTKMLFAE